MTSKSRRGVALILVLWLVVIMGAVGSAVVRDARGTIALAEASRAAVIARYAAESGVALVSAAMEDTLSMLLPGADRRNWLNGLEASGVTDTVVLGDGRFQVVVIDVSARLDVNRASEASLRTWFAGYTSGARAAELARAIRVSVDGNGGVDAFRAARPLRSLQELRDRGLVPVPILEKAIHGLTVDGDGTINERTATREVLMAATGELRQEPSRILIVSRGWMGGHPMTHEVQAVFRIEGNRLVLIRQRESRL